MGMVWCCRQVTYTPITSQGSYLEYVVMFDQLTNDHIIWTLYTQERVNACAPEGLSSLCMRDYVYWYTRRALVHDVFVQEYLMQRVMRQFGLRQEVPTPWVSNLFITCADRSTPGGSRVGNLCAVDEAGRHQRGPAARPRAPTPDVAGVSSLHRGGSTAGHFGDPVRHQHAGQEYTESSGHGFVPLVLSSTRTRSRSSRSHRGTPSGHQKWLGSMIHCRTTRHTYRHT